MIKGIHHISMKCGTAEVKTAGYEVFNLTTKIFLIKGE